jgi:hypothetical protein
MKEITFKIGKKDVCILFQNWKKRFNDFHYFYFKNYGLKLSVIILGLEFRFEAVNRPRKLTDKEKQEWKYKIHKSKLEQVETNL